MAKFNLDSLVLSNVAFRRDVVVAVLGTSTKAKAQTSGHGIFMHPPKSGQNLPLSSEVERRGLPSYARLGALSRSGWR